MKYAKWAGALAICFSLADASTASATYIVIENISDGVPNWGECNCHPATGWLGFVQIDLDVVEDDGNTYTLHMWPSDYYPRKQVNPGDADFFLLGVTKKNPVAPGEIYTSKKIVGLPESGFRFRSTQGSADIGVYYCEAAEDSCGGYSTGGTNVWPNGLFIVPGLTGSDSFDFQVPARPTGEIVNYSVVRVTFYPGHPPPHGQTK